MQLLYARCHDSKNRSLLRNMIPNTAAPIHKLMKTVRKSERVVLVPGISPGDETVFDSPLYVLHMVIVPRR